MKNAAERVVKLKVPVTLGAVVQRINRKLAPDGERLHVSRTEKCRLELGDYYVIVRDSRVSSVAQTEVDPEAMARELGVLHPWERIVDGGTR